MSVSAWDREEFNPGRVFRKKPALNHLQGEFLGSTTAHWLALGTDPDPTIPLHVRMHYLAMGLANTYGHAEFDPNQLRNLLATTRKQKNIQVKEGSSLPRAVGEEYMAVPASGAITKAVKLAVTTNRLRKGSSTRCLILPLGVAQNATRRSWCRVHEMTMEEQEFFECMEEAADRRQAEGRQAIRF